MKKVLYIILFFSVKVFSQSVTLEPGSNGSIKFPVVSTLGSCGSGGNGKVVYNSSDNNFYHCNGFYWQKFLTQNSVGLYSIVENSFSNSIFKVENTNNTSPGGSTVAIEGISNSPIGTGLYGSSLEGTGVSGISGTGNGAEFYSTSGYSLKTLGKLLFGGNGVGTIASGKVLKSINSNGEAQWGDDKISLPFSDTVTVSGNALSVYNDSPINGTVAILGRGKIGLYGVANDVSPTFPTVGVFGINNSTNSIGYGIQGGHLGSGIGGYFVCNNGTAGSFQSSNNYALKTFGKLSFSGNGVGTIAAGKVLKAINNSGDTEWAEPIAFPYVGSGISGVIATPLFQINNNQGASGGVAIKGVSSSVGVWGEIPSSVSGVGDAVYGVNNNTVFGGSGVRGAHTANGTGGSFFSQSGIGGYFSSTAGYALVTGTGNVGIGTNTPDKAGLVVNKLVGATSAIFGDNAAGVGVDVAWPGISLNGYYNGERKLLTNGYVGGISLDPATGLFRIYNSSSSGVAGAGIAQFDRLLIDNEGDVGIGINNPSASIHVVRGTGSGGTAQFLGTTHSSHFNYSTTENTYIRGGKDAANVYINDVAGLGNVAVGNGTPTEKLHVFGNLRVSGTICNTSGTIAACSDIRYKKNFSKIENPLQKVMSINGLHYDWRVDEFKENNFSKERQIGFIAQEIEKIFPEMVYTDEKGYKSVDYSRLTPVLVEAIKELKTLNDELKVKNERLESNTQRIESRLEKLEVLLVK